MSNQNVILQSLLNCGYLDVEFIDKELDRFNVDADDVVEYHKCNFGTAIEDANAFIYCLYYIAFNNAIDELGIYDLDFDKFETYCNCIDSHCYMYDNNGECSEMYSYHDILEFLNTHYLKSQDDVHNSK